MAVRSWVTYNKEDWIWQIKLKFASTSTIIDCQPLCQTHNHIVRHIVSHHTAVRPSQHLVVTSIASSYRPSLRRHIVPSYCWVICPSTGFTLYRHTVHSCCIVDRIIIPSVVTSSHIIIPCQVVPSRHCTIVAAMPRKKGKEVAKKTAQEGLVEWKKSDGKKTAQEGIMGCKLPLPQYEY